MEKYRVTVVVDNVETGERADAIEPLVMGEYDDLDQVRRTIEQVRRVKDLLGSAAL